MAPRRSKTTTTTRKTYFDDNTRYHRTTQQVPVPSLSSESADIHWRQLDEGRHGCLILGDTMLRLHLGLCHARLIDDSYSSMVLWLTRVLYDGWWRNHVAVKPPTQMCTSIYTLTYLYSVIIIIINLGLSARWSLTLLLFSLISWLPARLCI